MKEKQAHTHTILIHTNQLKMSGQKWKIKGMKNILFSYEFRKTVATPTPTITAAQS